MTNLAKPLAGAVLTVAVVAAIILFAHFIGI
jgi:hypothetical protein